MREKGQVRILGLQVVVLKAAGALRNHGKPVALAERYYQDGADATCQRGSRRGVIEEVSFLNITAFRDMVLADQPMLEVWLVVRSRPFWLHFARLRRSAERVFVPLTVGGGIRSYVDGQGQSYSALQVADAYFRAGLESWS